tara:strand:+ start:4783 stop:5841 length:1059 start_codon:yes stop_codon:yes gene_type:complete
MLKFIKKNTNFKSGIIFFIFISLIVFIFSNIRKTKTKDISNYIVSVEKGFLSESINSSGEIKASKEVRISPRKQGFIKFLNVDEGEFVKEDDLLAVLDDKDFVFKIEELRLKTEKQKSDFERRKFLFNEGAVSKEDFEDFKNRYKTSAAKLNDAMAEKSFYQIRAPFSGIITGKYVEIGSYVAPSANISSNPTSKNFIFELSDGIEIVAKVPESDIGRIKINQEAIIRIESYPSRKFKAKITKIAPRAIKDNNVTSFEVTLRFQEENDDIKVGMTADLEFKVKNDIELLLIPTVSIVTDNGKKGILKVNNNNSPIFKEIELGITSGSKTAVINGLEEGDKIFVDIPPWSKKY